MIIKRVVFNDFGIYGGQSEFELTPQTGDQFSRPIILFSGKNGAGKTTFVEGIRLCLHGSLALGDRVSRRRYEEHLLKRIHRPFREDAQPPDAASITLEFDFVRGGENHTYVAARSWHRTPKSVSERITVTEDGAPPEDLQEEQKESFLRELVPSSAADLFFFDGEKIDTLTDEEEGTDILKETVNSLLGLHLVDRLSTDLDVFIERRAEGGGSRVKAELEEARTELETLREQGRQLKSEYAENREAIQGKQSAIEHQRQAIQEEGGEYANRRTDLEQRRELLEQKIETQEKRVQDLADGVMPFAVAPGMCQSVARRLEVERQHQQWTTSQELIEEQVGQFSAELEKDEFWEEADIPRSERARERLLGALSVALRRSNPAAPVDADEVVIHASERERGKLSHWIEEALRATPDKFTEATQRLIQLGDEMEDVQSELALVPDDLILQPLVTTLNALVKGLTRLQKRDQELADDIGTTEFKTEQAENHLSRVKERLEREQKENERVQLAFRTQRAMREYAARLKEKKLALLEESLTGRFNQLCRKASILESVDIDPDTFKVALRRAGERFGRDELSAGEKQLFAIATIWALREVSGIPMPVIIDTPLGRLDKDHRQSMIETYLPRASHQVLLLATDAEVDRKIMREIEPALSHAYRLHFDEEQSRTVIESLDVTDGQQELFEEAVAA